METGWIKGMLSDYPYAAEVNGSIPNEWVKANIEEVTVIKNSGIGLPDYPHTYRPMGWVMKSTREDNHFIFFSRKGDREKLIRDHPDKVVNGDPFTTVF